MTFKNKICFYIILNIFLITICFHNLLFFPHKLSYIKIINYPNINILQIDVTGLIKKMLLY